MVRRFDGQVAWITGGGSGIGRALALRFAAEGATVAVSGRRQDRLDQVVAEVEALGGRGLALALDVTDEAAVAEVAKAVSTELGRMDVCVANAGFSIGGKIERLSAEDWRRQFDVNVVGLAITAKHALPALRASEGRLGLVGSVAGLVTAPGFGAYHASKYAVRAIGQALALEISGSGASCTLLHPGFVESEIGQVDNEGVFHEDRIDARPQRFMWPTDKAAGSMVDALHRRKREHVFTTHGRIGAFLGMHFPGLVHFILDKQRARVPSPSGGAPNPKRG